MACLENNAYVLQTPNREVRQAKISENHGTLLEWHRRLGHMGFDNVKRLEAPIPSMVIDGSRTNPICVSCVAAKQTRKPNSAAATRTSTAPLQLIHSDVAGPMRTLSLGGAKYFLLFIDDFSRFTAVFTLRQKSDVTERFLEYKAWAENLHGMRIKALRSDNGGEYTSYQFTKILKENGITHEKTVPYSPEQNRVSERSNRTLVGRAKAMMLDNNLAEELWGEAIRSAVYLKNRTPTSAITSHKTPFELWIGNPIPDLSHLILFGTHALRHIPKNKRTKWEQNGERCIVIGYEGTNQYRVLIGRKIYCARDIHVIGNGNDDNSEEESTGPGVVSWDLQSESEEESEKEETVIRQRRNTRAVTRGEERIRREETNENATTSKIPKPAVPDPTTIEPPASIRTDSPTADWEALAHSMRDSETAAGSQRTSGRASAGRFFSTKFHEEAFLATAMLDNEEPAGYKEAITSPLAKEWEKAIEEELVSLKVNRTWGIVDLPESRTPIKCKWVFRVKRGPGGEVIRYKARLVAKGFTQWYGVDYLETYSPVVKLTSLRIMLAIAAARNYEIDQTDIKTAYVTNQPSLKVFLTGNDYLTIIGYRYSLRSLLRLSL